jgi:hypothetical protein
MTTKLKIEVEVSMEIITNAIVGFVENGYSPWAQRFVHDDKPDTIAAINATTGDKTIWYAREGFWEKGGTALLTYDRATDPEGAGGGSMTIGMADLQRGLKAMADNAPRHLADLVNENDDAVTHDVFMQMVVFGEIIYG